MLSSVISQISRSSPMKKKSKVDPMIAIQKELKKKRKIEKAIRQIEKKGRVLKPVDEIEGPRDLMKTLGTRKREKEALTFEESERRALMIKEWTRYKRRQHMDEMYSLHRALSAQQRALEELREESEELYQQAIQIDEKLISHSWNGPTHTPPVTEYEAPDGDYTNTTKTFEDLPIGPLFQAKKRKR